VYSDHAAGDAVNIHARSRGQEPGPDRPATPQRGTDPGPSASANPVPQSGTVAHGSYECIPMLLAVSLIIFMLVPEIMYWARIWIWKHTTNTDSTCIPILFMHSGLIPGPEPKNGAWRPRPRPDGRGWPPLPWPNSGGWPLAASPLAPIPNRSGGRGGYSCVHFVLNFCPFWWQVPHIRPTYSQKMIIAMGNVISRDSQCELSLIIILSCQLS
jgi:hypothetical protein